MAQMIVPPTTFIEYKDGFAYFSDITIFMGALFSEYLEAIAYLHEDNDDSIDSEIVKICRLGRENSTWRIPHAELKKAIDAHFNSLLTTRSEDK